MNRNIAATIATVKFFLPLFVLLFVLTGFVYYSYTSARREVLEKLEKHTVLLQKNYLGNDIKAVISDLLFLARDSLIFDYFQKADLLEPDNDDHIREEFLSFSKTTRLYDQIRLLGDAGMELIRINFNTGAPVPVPKTQLQNKGKRYYFADTFRLKQGEIFVSPIDLNIEHGKIEMPLKPVIRFGVPVFDSQNKKRGVVLLNYLALEMIHRFKGFGHSEIATSMLLNRDGYFMSAHSPDDEWGFMYEQRKERVFALKYSPKAWRQITSKNSGQFETEKGLFTFTTIFPLLEVQRSSTWTGKPFAQSGNTVFLKEYYWKIVSFIPEVLLYEKSRSLRNRSILFVLCFGVALFYFCRRLASSEGLKKEAELALQSSYAELEEKVKQRTEELAKTNQMLLSDIVRRKKIEKELNDYQVRLEEMVKARTKELESKTVLLEKATRLKSDFLASMSHELRTPMNSIIGFTGRVIKKSGELLPEKQLNNLKTVERNANHLLKLINGLLDLSKIEAGKMDVIKERFCLRSLLEEVLELSAVLTSEKDVDLKGELPEKTLFICSDKMKLKQILINLIGNAAKFTSQGSISISARVLPVEETKREHSMPGSGKYIELSVSDTGAGMTKQEMEHIFDAFKQVGGFRSEKEKGSGLGLNITKEFVRLLEGKITVQSQKGKGSKFIVTIPDSEAVLEQPPIIIKERRKEDLVVKGNTVLCIDDDPEVLDLLQEYLSEEGYSVAGALTADEGIEKAKQLHPIAITLDIHMPNKDGWTVLKELKTLEATKGIPIIMVTIMDNKQLGYSLGAYDYIQKPVQPDILLASINKIAWTCIQSVLVVDDDPDVRDLTREALEEKEMLVRTASNGKEALEMIEEDPPGLILLDLMMPVMDGFEVIQELKRNEKKSQIPVIVFTSKTLTASERDFLTRRVVSISTKEGGKVESVLRGISGVVQKLRKNQA